MAKTAAPKAATIRPILADFRSDMNDLNDAVLRDADRQRIAPREIDYNSTTDQGLASRRSKHMVRSCAESEAARSGDLPLGTGMSLRAPMAGQCENDQFPYTTDPFGKQRS